MNKILKAVAGPVFAVLLVGGCTATANDASSESAETTDSAAAVASPSAEATTEAEQEAEATEKPAPQVTEKAAPEVKPTPVPSVEELNPSVGDTVQDGQFEFVVLKSEYGVESLSDSYSTIEAQGQFVVVHLQATNIGNEALYLAADEQRLIDTQGRKHSASMDAEFMWPDSVNVFYTDINPGLSLQGAIVFDIPADAAPDSIELHDDLLSHGVTVSLAE